ncbi:MAG TPA: hypothetical protein VJY35_17330, partial [Candidatus Eisenbacteria bacterium]|nr:hypothetical protein [Candidatus Eisenbacteria bacterium]
PVPQSALAKAAVYGHPGPIQGRAWWDWLLPFPLGGAPKVAEGVHLFLLSVLMAPAVVMGAPVVWRARRMALGLAAGAALTVWLGYAALGVAYFFWYLTVPLAGFLLLAACGMPRIVRSRAVYVSMGIYMVGIWTMGYQLYVGRAKLEEGMFVAVADHLAARAQPGQQVFLEPIGMIGYRNPLVVIDEVGLVSPAVARRRAQGPGWYTDIVAERRPDWLVVRGALLTRAEGFAALTAPLRNPAERDSLLARYAVSGVFPPDGGDQAMVVLQRVR